MAVQRNDASLRATEVLDRVLDKCIVIDADISIAVAGIALVTVKAVVTVASFATWRRYVALAELPRRAAAPPSRAPARRLRVQCAQGCTFERGSRAAATASGGHSAAPSTGSGGARSPSSRPTAARLSVEVLCGA